MKSNQKGIEVTVTPSKTIVIRNTAVWNGGGAANYVLSAGTHSGAIMTSGDMGANFSNANPWANISL